MSKCFVFVRFGLDVQAVRQCVRSPQSNPLYVCKAF